MSEINTEYNTYNTSSPPYGPYNNSDGAYSKKSQDGKTIFWFCSTNSGMQFNSSHGSFIYTYYYFAIA